MKKVTFDNLDNKLEAFLYILGRDHLTLGQIEDIMEKHVDKVNDTIIFSNGYLAEYAVDLAIRLGKK